MRKKQIFLLIIVFGFINVGIISFALFATASPKSGQVPLEELAIMDLTHEKFIKRESEARIGAVQQEPMGSSPSVQPGDVGEQFNFTVSDDGLGTDYDEEFRIILEGTHSLILVTEDAYQSYLVDGTYYNFSNPYGTWGRYGDLIPHTQFEYLMTEFDENIYPTLTNIFGIPDNRPEFDAEGHKVWVLIWNIRDDAYYSETAEFYIAGYYSLSTSNENDKNIMHIDSYDWANRVGPGVARPFLYEGTFAHEFEHMIHSDIDADEPSWVDEGLADLAMLFSGYGHSSGHIVYYFLRHFYTPLTFWGSGLQDYGASYLFQLYLYEKYANFDTSFFTDLVAEEANGIEGIENVLSDWGFSISFGDIFDDWTIANYFDDPTPGSLYGYDTLDVGTADTWGYSIEFFLADPGWYWIDPFGAKYWPLPQGLMSSWFLGAPQPYTAQYWRFGGPSELRVAIEGDITAGPYPNSGDWAWYSDVGGWAWRSFNQSFSVPNTGATLEFYTYFEIEDDWDYGYVEVLSDGEWYTLNATNFDMTTDIAHPQDNPNCPDGREPTDYEAAGRWFAFTSSISDWTLISMDLSLFAGEDIELYFTTWQDGAFTLQMMYVDDINITGPDISYFDDVESLPSDWTTTGWDIYKSYEFNNWQATLIEVLWQPTKRYARDQNWHARELLNEVHMEINYATQSGEITGIRETPAKSRRSQVIIVSNRVGHILPADYWIEFTFA